MDRIGIVLFDATLSTAVFFTIIILSMMACRQPVRRILLARVALLSSLLILPLVQFGRLPRLDVIDTFVESRFFPRAVFLTPTPLEPPDIMDEDAGSPAGARWVPGRLVPSWLSGPRSSVAPWLPRGLTLIDLSCVAAASGWLVLGLAGVHWLIGRSRPPSHATKALFDQLVAVRSRSAARAGLRVSPRLRHPVVTGLFRPTILIPEALDRADADPGPLRLSLLHEIAHAERSDHWFSTIAAMAQAVWFFLPHVWWLRSQLLIDQEFLADRSAAERYGTSSEYASSLLSLATHRMPKPGDTTGRPADQADGPASGTIGVQSPLFQRMLMLLHCPYPVESRTPRLWSWTSRVAVIGASIAAACLMIRWPQSSFALPADPPAATASGPRFQVAYFVAKPLHEGDGSQRSLVYVLPVALPAAFDLDVDILSTAADLAQVRIAGQPLGIRKATRGILEGLSDTPAEPVPERRWRHVHLHRDHRRTSVLVDGQPVDFEAPTEASSNWLTIEPPEGDPVEFRYLEVNW